MLNAGNGSESQRTAFIDLWRRDGLIRHFDQLSAASAHLDGDVAEGRPVELEARRLPVIGALDGGKLPAGVLLEVLYSVFLRPQEIILA